MSRLKNPTNPHRPSNEKALRAHISTALGKETSSAKVDAIVRELCESRVITIDDAGRIGYGGSGGVES